MELSGKNPSIVSVSVREVAAAMTSMESIIEVLGECHLQHFRARQQPL
jgi:hypothetical protein